MAVGTFSQIFAPTILKRCLPFTGIITLRKKPVDPPKRTTIISAPDPHRLAQGTSSGKHISQSMMSSQSQGSVQGRSRDRIATVTYPYRSAQGGPKEEPISWSTVSHGQSSTVQGDPPRQSPMFDIEKLVNKVRCTMVDLSLTVDFTSLAF